MLKPIKSILFATDLSANCQQALDFTLSSATRIRAEIYILYVIEKLPDSVDKRIKYLVGVHEWEDLVTSHKVSAHKSLLGKTPSNVIVRQAIYDFCKQEGVDSKTGDFESRQIIISYGDIVEDILGNASTNECDLIVLGSHKNVFTGTTVGKTTRHILKRSKIPVTIVPSMTT